jgi:adenylate cyclase
MGAALHVGEVAYGNIGASSRLDFTVIGAPVNEVCRVEALTRQLGETVLLTSAFTTAAGIEPRSLGRHALKGVTESEEVFALP